MWVGLQGEAMRGFSEGEYPRTTDKDGRFSIAGLDPSVSRREITAVPQPGMLYPIITVPVRGEIGSGDRNLSGGFRSALKLTPMSGATIPPCRSDLRRRASQRTPARVAHGRPQRRDQLRRQEGGWDV